MFRAELHMFFGEFDKSLNITNKLQYSDNLIVKCLANQMLQLYNAGWFHPPISLEKAQEYFEKVKSIYQDIDIHDAWERAYIGPYYKMSHWVAEANVERKIELIKECQEISIGMPEYSLEWRSYTDITFGNFYQQLGKFDLAMKHFERGVSHVPESDISIFYLNSQALLSTVLGRLDDANNYIDRIQKITKTSETPFYHNTDAEQYRLKTLELSRQSRIDFYVHRETYNLFSFYLRMYNITKDNQMLEKASSTRDTLKELANQSSEDTTIKRLKMLADGFILKMGGMRDKVRAMDIFEKILSFFPSGMERFYEVSNPSIELKMHLVELYFEDLSSEILGNTLQKIETLMQEISNSPVMTNPQTIAQYSSYQILVAKYQFYVNGDISESLNLLYELKSHAESFNLDHVISQISSEIDTLESERTKWSNISLTTKERIEQSKIKSYMHEALKMASSATL
jgi:tetratricopeptide (TPR) repeat protein